LLGFNSFEFSNGISLALLIYQIADRIVDGVFKARLVFKNYKQKQEIDFDETFLLIALLKFIRILLAIVIYYNYEI